MARRKCPPGVICIENVTITFLICVLGLIGLYFYYSGFSPNRSTVIVNRDIISQRGEAFPRWNVIFYIMPENRSIDIDSKFDFELVEFLLKKRKSW